MAKKEKKPKSKKRKIIEWSITGVFLALICTVCGFKIYQNVSGDHAIFGTSYPVVLTDSMETEYMVGDVLKVAAVQPEEVKQAFDKGETIDLTFKWNIGTRSQPNIQMMTHRIVDVLYFEDVNENKNGSYIYSGDIYAYSNVGYHYTFVTHGINKNSNQTKEGEDLTKQLQFSTEKELVGVVNGKSQFLRVANQIFQSPWTLVLLIVIPGLYIVITSVLELFSTIDDDDEETAVASGSKPKNGNDPLDGLSEDDKERLKKQMLEELMKKGKK